MAKPVIDSAVANPATVNPGGKFVVTIAAHDPDAKTYQLDATVTDAEGNATAAALQLVVSDPLSFALDDGGAGFTITPRVGAPGVFDCVAP